MRRFRLRPKLMGFFLLVFVFMAARQLFPPPANALSQGTTGSWYPGSSAEADVSISGLYAITNLPSSWFEITTIGGGPISVQLQFHCNAGRLGFKVVEQGNPTPIGDYSNTCAGGAGGPYTTRPLGLSVPNGQVDSDGLNYVFIHVDAVDQFGQGGHLPFQIQVNGGNAPFISYAADKFPSTSSPGGSQFNSNDRAWGVFTGGISFDFQPPCDWSGGQPIYLKWNGADVGAPYQGGSLYSKFYDLTAGGGPIWQDSGSSLGRYGDSSVHQARIAAALIIPGHHYRWDWGNISGNNEIGLSVPFSSNSFDEGITCQPPQPPVQPPPTCTRTAAFTDPGAADGATDKLHSASFIRVVDSSGNTLVPQGGDPTQTFSAATFSNTYPAPNYAGRYVRVTQSSTQGPWRYQPLGANITVYTVREIHNVDTVAHTLYGKSIPPGAYRFFPNPMNPNPPFGIDGTINCYNSTIVNGACTLDVVGDGPGGTVIEGGTMHVSATVYNTGPGDLPASIAGHLLQLNNGDENGNGSFWGFSQYSGGIGRIPRGGHVNVTFDLTAPGSATPYSQPLVAHPAYSNLFAFGPGSACGTTVNVYAPFSLGVHADVNPIPSTEDPATINYDAYVINPNGVAIVSPTTSEFYGPPGNIAGPVSSGGPWNPGNDYTLNGSYTPSPVRAGDVYCAQIDIAWTAGYVGPGGPGDIVGQNTPNEAKQCFTVISRPFFKAYGGNVSAGGSFNPGGGSCAGGGYLSGWFNNTNPGNGYGSSTPLSALALVKVVGFASAQVVASRSPTDLTLANSGAGVSITNDNYSPNLGGSFGGAQCLPYQPPPTAATAFRGSSIPTTTGSYQAAGPVTLNAAVIPKGQNVTLFVNGDITLTGNVTYQAGWASRTDIPSLVLISNGGNIHIDQSVTELDGVYIAQPRGASGGKIYTCQQGEANHNLMFGLCNKQLNAYGSFVADQINMMRTFGSLRDEPVPVKTTCSNWDGVASNWQSRQTCAGEVFYLSPELYLSSPTTSPPSNGAPQWDAITSLPPVL